MQLVEAGIKRSKLEDINRLSQLVSNHRLTSGLVCMLIQSLLCAKEFSLACSVIMSLHGVHFQSMASKTPAATAEPITPDTFGPMACISR